MLLNPFRNETFLFLGCPKVKEFGDDNAKFNENGKKFS